MRPDRRAIAAALTNYGMSRRTNLSGDEDRSRSIRSGHPPVSPPPGASAAKLGIPAIANISRVSSVEMATRETRRDIDLSRL